MKVLIIDDNKEITEMVSFYLESQEISCRVVNDGKEGLNLIKQEHFDVILMDLAMPEFTGYDILTDLKRQNLIDKNNIIIFTASSVTDAEIEEMLKMGAKGILRKPVSIDDLTELIEREVQ
jgi:CheY-like chemotaxis protein